MGVGVHKSSRLRSDFRTELTRSPKLEPLGSAVLIPAIDVVCKIEEVRNGQFERFQVSDVDDPDLSGLSLIGEMQLFPGLLVKDSIDPFLTWSVKAL
jgi:hypothetical protein